MTALFGTKARSGVRDAVTVLPEQLLSPPYELRTEMNWIDFSGTANPLGTPPSFLSSIQEAFSAGETQLPARPRGPHPALGARAALRHARRVVSVRVHRRRHDTGGRPDLPALHRGRGHAWPGGVRARGGQRRPSGGRDTEPVGLRGARSPGRCAPRHLVRRGRAGQSRLPHQPPAAPADAPALPGDVRLGGGGRALHRAHAGGREHGAAHARPPQPGGGALSVRVVRHARRAGQLTAWRIPTPSRRSASSTTRRASPCSPRSSASSS